MPFLLAQMKRGLELQFVVNSIYLVVLEMNPYEFHKNS
jgi:hypothetical protein